jgi:hypothetical protein
MKIKAAEISDILRRQIRDYDREIDVAETGTVLSVGDGIARVWGLDRAMAGELVEFPGAVRGLVLNLEEDNVASTSARGTWYGGRGRSSRSPSARGCSAVSSTPWASRWTARAPSTRPRAGAWSSRHRGSSTGSR